MTTIGSDFTDMTVGTEVVTLSSYIGTVVVSMQLLLTWTLAQW